MKPRAAHLIGDLRHLRIKTYQPRCWLLKVSLLPWLSKRSEAERDAFLARLVNNYNAAAWGIDPMNFDTDNKTKDELTWITSARQVPPIIREKSYLGNWGALLFAHGIPDASTLPRQMVLSAKACGEAKRILESTGADVFLFSMPDDVEWLLAEGCN
jgi:hypothetical protein